ncbi:hypothetical protein KG088_06655 [Halomonas sp. TRM85114]|uniref:hypothetical protein n=1 Tax=Halomonas jincaotanensis TaxID=2810616 RepID=UPI001BD46831|nr:hypothetical protein [Halomonas jincaotanensis]MBS9403303.1 hypothetical protein [Halomonas jincaotanensis]
MLENIEAIFKRISDEKDAAHFVAVSLFYDDWEEAIGMLRKASDVRGDWVDNFSFLGFYNNQKNARIRREESGVKHDKKYLAFDIDFCEISAPGDSTSSAAGTSGSWDNAIKSMEK